MDFAHGGFGLISFALARITLPLLCISAISSATSLADTFAKLSSLSRNRERKNVASLTERGIRDYSSGKVLVKLNNTKDQIPIK